MADIYVPYDYGTIQAALTAASSSDTIHVTSGASYTGEDLSLFGGKSSLTLLNETGATCTVTLLTGKTLTLGSSWTVGQLGAGFTFRGDSGYVLWADDVTSCNVWDCLFERSSGSGEVIRTRAALSTCQVTFWNCEVTGSYSTNPLMTSAVFLDGYPGQSNNTSFYGGILKSGAAGLTFGCNLGSTTMARVKLIGNHRGVYVQGSYAGSFYPVFNVCYGGTHGLDYDVGASYYPTISCKRNTFDVSGTAIKHTQTHSNANLTYQGNWGDTVERPTAGSWSYNGYRVLAVGSPGYQDVTTLADPGFVNMGSNDYHLLDSSSLIDGFATPWSSTDHDGLPATSGVQMDIGAFEYQYTDCGIDSITGTGSLNFNILFTPVGGGVQAPDQTSAETASNWSLTLSGDSTLCVLTATVDGSDPYTYHVVTNHRMMPYGGTVTVDTTAIATDSGGYCDDPGTGQFGSVSDGVEVSGFEWPQEFGPVGIDGEGVDL